MASIMIVASMSLHLMRTRETSDKPAKFGKQRLAFPYAHNTLRRPINDPIGGVGVCLGLAAPGELCFKRCKRALALAACEVHGTVTHSPAVQGFVYPVPLAGLCSQVVDAPKPRTGQ